MKAECPGIKDVVGKLVDQYTAGKNQEKNSSCMMKCDISAD